MKINRVTLQLALASISLALPLTATAEIYLSATTGSGPNGFRFNELRGEADIFDTAFSANMFGYRSSSSAAEDVSQSGLGLDWRVSELAKVGIKHNKVNNSSIDISGNALSLGLSMNTLWDSELLTRLDLKRTDSTYTFNDLPPAVKNDTIKQTANSFGLTQDFTQTLSVYGGYDRYSYDRDPRNAASVLLRLAPRRYVNTATSLLSFPDKSYRLGISWRLYDPLTLDLSGSKTSTQLEQSIKTTRLGIDYRLSDQVNISAAVSRVAATAV